MMIPYGIKASNGTPMLASQVVRLNIDINKRGAIWLVREVYSDSIGSN